MTYTNKNTSNEPEKETHKTNDKSFPPKPKPRPRPIDQSILILQSPGMHFTHAHMKNTKLLTEQDPTSFSEQFDTKDNVLGVIYSSKVRTHWERKLTYGANENIEKTHW